MKRIIRFLIVLAVPLMLAANTLTVAKVHSGDLIEFEGGFTIHLTGISVPDKSTRVGYKAYDFTKRELEGKVVKLFTYTTNNMASGIVRDEDGYAFGQIVYGSGGISRLWSVNFNEQLLKKGYARVAEDRLPEDLQYFKEIEQEARKAGVGMWEKHEKN